MHVEFPRLGCQEDVQVFNFCFLDTCINFHVFSKYGAIVMTNQPAISQLEGACKVVLSLDLYFADCFCFLQ